MFFNALKDMIHEVNPLNNRDEELRALELFDEYSQAREGSKKEKALKRILKRDYDMDVCKF